MSDDDALKRVYAARTPEELSAAYADWAATYDRDTVRDGYHLPFSIAAWVARHVAVDARPILDAGCGSGMSGPVLAALGYSDIEGLDFSADMLRLAATRGAYSKLTQAELGKALLWPNDLIDPRNRTRTQRERQRSSAPFVTRSRSLPDRATP